MEGIKMLYWCMDVKRQKKTQNRFIIKELIFYKTKCENCDLYGHDWKINFENTGKE